MTTREIYFKYVMLNEIPIGRLGYTIKDNEGIIHIGSNITLEARTDERVVQDSLKKMKEIEKKDDFMFWNISPEGEEWFNKHWGELSKIFTQMVLNQK